MYEVVLRLDAPTAHYDVGQVAAAVGLAMSDYEGTKDLELHEIRVEREDA